MLFLSQPFSLSALWHSPLTFFMTARGPPNGSENDPNAGQFITSEGSLHSGFVNVMTFLTPGDCTVTINGLLQKQFLHDTTDGKGRRGKMLWSQRNQEARPDQDER